MKHKFDVGAAAGEVGLPIAVVEEMRKEPAVDLAMRNWSRYRRLPPPCSPRKVRPYRARTRRAG